MAASKPAIAPVAPMPTGQPVLPHTGHTLFSARAPAKIDHQPARRRSPEVTILLFFVGISGDAGIFMLLCSMEMPDLSYSGEWQCFIVNTLRLTCLFLPGEWPCHDTAFHHFYVGPAPAFKNSGSFITSQGNFAVAYNLCVFIGRDFV